MNPNRFQSPKQRNRPAPPVATPPSPQSRVSVTALGIVAGVLVGAAGLGALTWSSGCSDATQPPGRASDGTVNSSDPLARLPTPPPMPQDQPDAPEVEEPDPPKAVPTAEAPYEGPWLIALARATPIYPTARFSRNRMGYIRKGSKAPVKNAPLKTKSCKGGFYPLVDGGYVCGKYAKVGNADSKIADAIRAPNIDALLPYRYAFNRAHGTPLYRKVPSRSEMLKYEPYLEEKKKAKADAADQKRQLEKADQPRANDESKSGKTRRKGKTDSSSKARTSASGSATPSARASADGSSRRDKKPTVKGRRRHHPSPGSSSNSGPTKTASEKRPQPEASAVAPDAPKGSAAATNAAPSSSADPYGDREPEKETPWWRGDKGKSIDVKLTDLEENDGVLAKRMVKGFFVAVDKTFGRNNRMWYRTTGGLLTPTDRMIIPKTPELKGLEWPKGAVKIGFVRASRAYQYTKGDKEVMKRGKRLKRHSSHVLTGETALYKKRRYHETVDGYWLSEGQATITEPGKRPDEVKADEKWVDVNLTRKTLVAFIGDQPVYASLFAPGKKSKVRSKDHRTKVGKFRVREKHITTTMDGDGTSGDLPYSIQDVPYVQYYDGSYALHGAFWHNNFGFEQSHGCVNLAPNDAKYLFNFTEPQLPRGWHGVWSSDKRRGTLIVVHN